MAFHVGYAGAMHTSAALLSTPLGKALCRLNERAELVELKLVRDAAESSAAAGDAQEAAVVQDQLDEYFAGGRQRFDIPLAPQGTEFQRRVWGELLRIPHGRTTTYSELAARLGDPQAVRAVGRANGANPIWLVIPCHRVVGADGSLTGYAAGLEVKRWLLQHEGALPSGLFADQFERLS